MALRQIALGAKATAIPRSVRTRLEVLDLISRDDYGQLVLTENGLGSLQPFAEELPEPVAEPDV